MVVAAMGTVMATMSSVAGGLIYPWEFAATMRARAPFLSGLAGCITDHGFWYVVPAFQHPFPDSG